jgi:phage terminase large subunit
MKAVCAKHHQAYEVDDGCNAVSHFLDSDDDAYDMDPDELVDFQRRALRIMRSITEDAAKKDRFFKYRDDPIGFFKDILGVEPWESEDPNQSGQADLLRAIVTHDKVAAKSGQKTSKTCSAVGIALWWAATRRDATVVMTAPSFTQIKDVLWTELQRQNMPRVEGTKDANGDLLRPPYRDSLEKVLGVTIPLDPATGVKFPETGNKITGKSTNTPERMAGTSSPNLLFIIDEGSGYANEIYEAVLGNLTGGGKLFVISNPTQTSGWFYDLFIDQPEGWKLFTLNSENTPNVRAGRRVIPGVAERKTIEEWRARAGADYMNNPFYLVRVLGMFPPQGSNSVISMTVLERASAKWKPDVAEQEPGGLVIGVDVARQGDDTTVVWPIRGHYAYEPTALPRTSFEGGAIAGEIIRIASACRISAEDVRVNIDASGLGWSPVDFLRRSQACQDGWLHVSSLVVGEVADTEDQHVNLRTQLWFGCAEWLKEGGKLRKNERVIKELLSATYAFDARGRLKVEPKDMMKLTLGGKSPDYADALCMAVYRGPRGAIVNYSYDAAPDPRHTDSKGDGWDDNVGGGRWG